MVTPLFKNHELNEDMFKNLIGEKNQIPPKFSAIKVNGKRAYNLARKGKKFTLKSRKVFLKNIFLFGEMNSKNG